MSTESKDYLKAGDGYVDITLRSQLEVNGAKVKVLRMREPTVQDQITMDDFKGGQAAQELHMFANLTEQAPDDLKRLALRDYKRVQEGFLSLIAE